MKKKKKEEKEPCIPERRESTLRDFLASTCAEWTPDHGSTATQEILSHWFAWPPDAFLMTSRLIEDMGIYRFPAVRTGDRHWPQEAWDTQATARAEEWRKWLFDRTGTPEWIRKALEHLANALDQPMASIFEWHPASNTLDEEGIRTIEIARLAIEIHAVADLVCADFGLPSGHNHPRDPDRSRLTFLANMLLISTGSLSRLPRHQGIVLPKMRTPQTGLTLRSLSLHLTCHRTDVEVKWRSLPWVNQDENTANVLVVPIPYRIRPSAFRPHTHPGFSESLGNVRYFDYSPRPSMGEEEAGFSAEAIVDYVLEAQKHVHKVNLIVFPESSMTLEQLRAIQVALQLRFAPDVPLVVAGVTELPDVGNTEIPASLATNRVFLTTYFAGKWYDIDQAKHHRWRLDGPQIEQYRLAGALAGTQIWWEAIDLPKRQVCCLAPNGWLALCPLICEDLARQEPVAQVIRGVGPTLVLALLLDGPQMKARWSARYASVLADDPGSSVLTVTSFGMATRSEGPDGRSPEEKDEPVAVALWKDQKGGFREIMMGKEHGAVVLTLSAERVREYVADGRDDNGMASLFVLQGCQALPRLAAPKKEAAQQPMWGDPVDILELSILTHLVDAVLAQDRAVVEQMCDWALDISSANPLRFEREMLALIRRSRLRSPQGARSHSPKGRAPADPNFVKADMRYAVECFRSIMLEVAKASSAREEQLVEHASRYMCPRFKRDIAHTPNLAAQDEVRVHGLVGRSILWALHKRFDSDRRFGHLTLEGSRRLRRIEQILNDRHHQHHGTPDSEAELEAGNR